MTSSQSRDKADFGDIYNQPDPRAYFWTLEPLDYVIPGHGAAVFTQLLDARSAVAGRRPKVLDVCCSYGVGAMLLKTHVDLKQVYAHYRDAESLSRDELVAADRRLLSDHHRAGDVEVVGLDAAQHAVDYGLATGALDAGVTENLERDEPSARLAALLSDVDLVTVTGGVGYVTDRTFDQLLDGTPASTWVAAFCLRTYDYSPIAEALGRHGLFTESATRTFPQRRFAGPEEKQWAVEQVRSRDLDPSDKEEDGYFHADFFLARPEAEVARRPLKDLLPGLDGSA